MLERIHIFICLIAALVTVVFGIVSGMTLKEFTVPFIVTVIVFYFAGLFARGYLRRKVFPKDAARTGDASGLDGDAVSEAVEAVIDADDDEDFDDEDEDADLL